MKLFELDTKFNNNSTAPRQNAQICRNLRIHVGIIANCEHCDAAISIISKRIIINVGRDIFIF